MPLDPATLYIVLFLGTFATSGLILGLLWRMTGLGIIRDIAISLEVVAVVGGSVAALVGWVL